MALEEKDIFLNRRDNRYTVLYCNVRSCTSRILHKINNQVDNIKKWISDKDEIQTHAGRTHWISSPTP